MKKSIFILLLLAFACFQAKGQSVSVGLAADPVWGNFHLRGEADMDRNLRFGLEYTQFKRQLIALTADSRRIYLKSWYSGPMFSYLLPLGRHWAIYSRLGFGVLWSGFAEDTSGLSSYGGFSYSAAGKAVAGAEYRLKRLRFFADTGILWSLRGYVDYPMSVAVGVGFAFLGTYTPD